MQHDAHRASHDDPTPAQGGPPDRAAHERPDDRFDDLTDEQIRAELDADIAELTEPTVSRTTTDPAVTRAFAIECARLLEADKCEHIVVLDVRGRSQVADYVIVGSGTSDRQMNSALDHAVELGARYGFHAMRTNKDDRSTWLLADFVDVIAHLFEPNTRAYYDIEMLWGDAPRVEWRRPDAAKGKRG